MITPKLFFEWAVVITLTIGMAIMLIGMIICMIKDFKEKKL